jgi:hypothetical protein
MQKAKLKMQNEWTKDGMLAGPCLLATAQPTAKPGPSHPSNTNLHRGGNIMIRTIVVALLLSVGLIFSQGCSCHHHHDDWHRPPGHDPDGPGNSENAPGHNKDDWHHHSKDAPPGKK